MIYLHENISYLMASISKTWLALSIITLHPLQVITKGKKTKVR